MEHPLPNYKKQNLLVVFIVSAPMLVCTRGSNLERPPSFLPKIMLVPRDFLRCQVLHFLHVWSLLLSLQLQR